MRVGTSGLGVIAVVSVLVIAAPPERDDAAGAERESGIDHSTTAGASRISSKGYSWPSQVTAEASVSGIPGSFVKIEFERFGLSSPEASRSSLVRRVRHTVESTETPTASLPRKSASSRELGAARNFADVVATPDVRSGSVGSLERTSADDEIHRVAAAEPTLVYSSPKEFTEKFVVTLDSPPPSAIVESSIMPLPRPPAAGERETIREGGRTENPNNHDDKVSTGGSTAEPRNRRARSSGAKSAGTMNHQLTTTTTSSTGRTKKTSPRRSLIDADLQDPTERHQTEMIRGTRESSENKASNGEAHFVNGEPELNDIRGTTERIISGDFEELPRSDSGYLPGYSSFPGPTADIGIHDGLDRGIAKSGNDLVDKSSTKVDSDPARLALYGAKVELRESTLQSINDTASRKRETAVHSGVTEEISRSGQMTSDSSLDLPIFAVHHPRLSGNLANTSVNLVPVFRDAASFDNHKAFKVPTFQSAGPEQQHRQRAASTGSLPTRFHDVIGDNKAAPANQIAPPKSAYPVANNQSKTSINLVDARANKIFYEIKPSLITEMDRGDNVEVTPTPRKIFEKFFIPSVPSAFGKFGPYFLDEEDRRNVTERIGNTVQLDCRIGLLGHRKVTWLQHYKDSFRLLTVERESYSVDRRISLNFQYPNNWRLQIAYASLRDSGLYKCQVEIDQDRSLVKRYNVIITAPVLTITDDSGRPISGERHLKAGSALKLRCEARDVIQRLNESVLWMRGDETLAEDVRFVYAIEWVLGTLVMHVECDGENKTTESVNEKDITVVVSTLIVERATPRHAGNYSCVVPDKAKNTIAVHVLNGELPAAVQHGSGVSTAVLNLWLIHLTASYGFFR